MDEYICREAVLQTLQKANIGGYITERLLEIPFADVQPVKYGRWIDLDGRILCSYCGSGYDDTDEVKINTYLFCPNCGADMREENKNEP